MIVPEQLRALVVDDNAYARGAAVASLRKLGLVSIVEADSGMEAIGQLSSAGFDVMFLDWYMPEMSGAALLHVIRDPRFGRCDNLPVILITAYGNPETAALARTFGVTEVLDKPFSSDAVAMALGRVLKLGWMAGDAAKGEEDAVFL